MKKTVVGAAVGGMMEMAGVKTMVVRIMVEVEAVNSWQEMAGLNHFGWMVIYLYSCRNDVILANYS